MKSSPQHIFLVPGKNGEESLTVHNLDPLNDVKILLNNLNFVNFNYIMKFIESFNCLSNSCNE